MAYNPSDHTPTGRQAFAAWVVCGSLAASAFGVPVLWNEAKAVLQHGHVQKVMERPPVDPAPSSPFRA
jgi:hypothetical protein